jgi:pSer/pThr/pTyr-binding forkhead associated (FHA) protein
MGNENNIFKQQTQFFNLDEGMQTMKKANINATSALPRLEVNGQSKSLSHKAFGIGRDKSNQLIVADNKVSRFHAVVTFENEEAYIKDTDSSNGTYINNKKIQPGKKVLLNNGDKIKVGNTVIIYYR